MSFAVVTVHHFKVDPKKTPNCKPNKLAWVMTCSSVYRLDTGVIAFAINLQVRTNLIHDFMSVRFCVKLGIDHEKSIFI